MRKALNDWPEIIFVDGTYRLLKRGFITILFCVQDGMGLTHIVGVAWIANELAVTLTEVFTIFMEKNIEASKKIKCFMTDKDLTERAVISVLVHM